MPFPGESNDMETRKEEIKRKILDPSLWPKYNLPVFADDQPDGPALKKFIQGLLEQDPEKRLTQEDIKESPFLSNYIPLGYWNMVACGDWIVPLHIPPVEGSERMIGVL